MSEEVKEISERSSYLSDGERFSLVILGRSPASRHRWRLLWAAAWIIVGIVVTLEAKRADLGQDMRMMLLVFMSFWAYYLYRIAKAIRWHQVGKEMFMMKDEHLIHKNAFGQLGRSKRYHLANVDPLQIKPPTEGWGMMFEDGFWSKGKATLQLPIAGRVLEVGFGLDEAEAQRIRTLFNKELRVRQKDLDSD